MMGSESTKEHNKRANLAVMARMPEVACLKSSQLSTFRTQHEFQRYAKFTTVDEYIALLDFAASEGLHVYLLGNGSNTLFKHRRIRTLILHNKLKRGFRHLGGNRYEASSSDQISSILKYCREHHLDSFFYLASVPATVGGALAMNAGRGGGVQKTIYDYVESIMFVDHDGEMKLLTVDKIERSPRKTAFTGVQPKLITGCIFRFNNSVEDDDKIRERIEWCKQNQDLSAPNCGTLFKVSSAAIMKKLQGIGIFGARFSPITRNWMLNRASSPLPIRFLIGIAIVTHRLLGRKIELEIIEVD